MKELFSKKYIPFWAVGVAIGVLYAVRRAQLAKKKREQAAEAKRKSESEPVADDIWGNIEKRYRTATIERA